MPVADELQDIMEYPWCRDPLAIIEWNRRRMYSEWCVVRNYYYRSGGRDGFEEGEREPAD